MPSLVVSDYLDCLEQCDVTDLVLAALCLTICLKGMYVLVIKPFIFSVMYLLVSASTVFLFGLCLGLLVCWQSYVIDPEVWYRQLAVANHTLHIVWEFIPL